jgi:hypothetical protein
MFPYLTTERLQLRPLSIDDAQEICLLRSDEKHNEFIDRPRATSLDDAKAFINKIEKLLSEGTSHLGGEFQEWSRTYRYAHTMEFRQRAQHSRDRPRVTTCLLRQGNHDRSFACSAGICLQHIEAVENRSVDTREQRPVICFVTEIWFRKRY